MTTVTKLHSAESADLTRPRILVIDDDPAIGKLVESWLGSSGYSVSLCQDSKAAKSLLLDHAWELVISDIQMAGLNGLDLLNISKSEFPERPVILMTSHELTDYAIQALKGGADDYLMKPLQSHSTLESVGKVLYQIRMAKEAQRNVVLAIGAHPDDVEIGVGGLLSRHRNQKESISILTLTGGEEGGIIDARMKEAQCAAGLHRLAFRVSQLEREVDGRGYPGIVGASEAMKDIYRQLDKLSLNDVTVLLHGESGTGKELIAKAIHRASGRSRGPFVPVNSGAIPESLVESELFGHERGSFTSAVSRRIGRFEEADGGTIFLDEVGELPSSTQVKLLRVLQERTFQRVGGTALLSPDFRLISATNRNLAEEVKAGRFREDLYFRLAVFELEIPPLRRRREDIPLLARSFIRELSSKQKSRAQALSVPALEIMMAYDWPGNIRELQNTIQHAMVVADTEQIQPCDLPDRLRMPETGLSRADAQGDSTARSASLEEHSRRLLLTALRKHLGNASAAMRELEIGRTRFYRMVKKFGLEEEIARLRQ